MLSRKSNLRIRFQLNMHVLCSFILRVIDKIESFQPFTPFTNGLAVIMNHDTILIHARDPPGSMIN
jgi:hypothetical protein